MSAPAVVGLWLGDRAEAGARHEALRALVAARAAGAGVALLDLRVRSGTLTQDLTEPEHRLLDALAEEGVVALRPTRAELRAALTVARSLIVVPDPEREGRPALLRLDAGWLEATEDGNLCAALRRAGQIARC